MSFWTTLVAFLVLILAFVIPTVPPISGLDLVCSFECGRQGRRAWHGLGDEPLGDFDRHFLHWVLAWSAQLYLHNLDLAAKGMTLMRMPICTWAWFITSCIALLAFAVLLPACILLILDRTAGTSFFIPSGLVVSDRLQPHSGGRRFSGSTWFWVLRTS